MNASATDNPVMRPAPGPFAGQPAGPAPDPAPLPPGRSWVIETTSGYTATGYLPSWAQSDPSRAGVPLEGLPVALDHVNHHTPVSGQLMPVTTGSGPTRDTVVLSGGIDCNPHHQDPAPRLPVVNLQITGDDWTLNLDPPALTAIAAKLRAQADYLDHHVRPQLIAARADWATHHTTT